MSTLFEHALWSQLEPYAHVTYFGDIIRLDFLRLPDELRTKALAIQTPCISCRAVVNPLRARALSDRSRIAGTETERRLFYGPTCLKEINAGCARTKEIKVHKEDMRERFSSLFTKVKPEGFSKIELRQLLTDFRQLCVVAQKYGHKISPEIVKMGQWVKSQVEPP